MKKTIKTISAFVVGVSALCACGSDFDQGNAPTDKVAITFSATQEISGETSRTVLGDDKKVNWQSDDVITIWDGTAKNTFSVSPDETDATKADISGTVTAGAESFVAVYPNSVGQKCEYTAEGITGLVIPTTQTATAGSFDPNAAIMVGETTGENLNFKHVCSFLKITTAAEYTKIVVSTKSAYIAGTFNVSGFDTTPILAETSGLKEITLSGTIAASTDYIIAIAPCYNVEGLTVKCYTSETAYIERKVASGKTPSFARGRLYDMGETTETNGWKASNEHEYVDLGLDVKWATCNVGATNPQDGGYFFAWGETTGYTSDKRDGRSFDWANYKWMAPDHASWEYCTKYTRDDNKTNAIWYSDGTYVGSTIDGITYKNLTQLEYADDAAQANWGGSWRMPTQYDFYQLIYRCYWEWTWNYNNTDASGYIVYKVKSDNDKGKMKYNGWSVTTVGSYSISDPHIFLPAAGRRVNKDLEFVGISGEYWSSSLLPMDSDGASYLYLRGDLVYYGNYPARYYGRNVRPVCP